MMRNPIVRPRTVLPGLLALLMLFSGAPTATADADGEGKEVHKRVIKIHRHCDEGDAECAEAEGEHHVVIHRGDGEGGHPHVWVDKGGHGFAFGGKGGFLGIELTELTPELRGHFGVPEEAGVMVAKVRPDSAAARAGLAVGDVVTEVDGETVASSHALARAISSHAGGETVTLGVWREGRFQTLSATLEEHKMHHRAAIALDCGDDDEDCGHAFAFAFAFAHGEDFDCGGAEPCEVRVECYDGRDCECTVNGEAADCQTLHGSHAE